PSLTSPVVSEAVVGNEPLSTEQEHQYAPLSDMSPESRDEPRLMSTLSPLALLDATSPNFTSMGELQSATVQLWLMYIRVKVTSSDTPAVGLQEACLVRHFVEDLAHAVCLSRIIPLLPFSTLHCGSSGYGNVRCVAARQ